MKIEIKIPKMGESIIEASIGKILKPSGSIVRADEEILEIETEKVNQVLSAPAAGKLELTVKSGDVVKVDQVIGSVDSDASLPVAKPAPQSVPPPASLPPARKKVDEVLGDMGKPTAAPPRTTGRETRVKMTKLRRVIAERLVKVKNETAMLTTFNEVDMSAIIAMREENQESFQKKHGIKLGFMSFFVKATVSALQQFPALNGRIDEGEIVYHQFYDIGIAVGTEKGLFVPVIRNADQLSYAGVEKELKVFADKAKNGTISVDEMQGGTFTITNGGVYGSMLSTPILNPPQSGILGMHKIMKRAVVMNDEIVIRPMMYVALSYDHRIIDGKEAVSFLVHIKNSLEDPARLILDI